MYTSLFYERLPLSTLVTLHWGEFKEGNFEVAERDMLAEKTPMYRENILVAMIVVSDEKLLKWDKGNKGMVNSEGGG